MPKPTKGPRLGGSPSHERIILANLASQLFEHGSITTTEAKAKRLRPLAERLISKAKRGDVHAIRQTAAVLKDRGIVYILVNEIAPTLQDRDGGYTRITKIGNRQGDNAPMAVIEIVTESVEESRSAKAKIKSKTAKVASKPAAKADKPAKDAKSEKAAKAEEKPVAEEAPVEETADVKADSTDKAKAEKKSDEK